MTFQMKIRALTVLGVSKIKCPLLAECGRAVFYLRYFKDERRTLGQR
jgi:hypothetical protein